jgi:hypothetical protein
MSKVAFKIGERMLYIDDLGESMNSQFLRQYESHFSGRGFDLIKLRCEALNLFDHSDGNYHAHDGFFNNFTIIWQGFLNNGLFKNAEHLWDLALNIAYEWENKNQNKRIHKGTPYYFWGVTCILNGDLEKGFLLMHQALEEDKKRDQTNTPKTPAYSFVTLDYENQNQFFRPKVVEIAKFVDEKMNIYRSSRGGTLTLPAFKSKFLEESALPEVVFYFIFELFRLKKLLAEIDQRLTQNVFSSLLQANTILDFCIIVENIIKNQNKYRNKNLKQQTIKPLLEFLSSNSSLNLHKNDNLKNLNNDFGNDFSKTVQQLIMSQHKFQDGTTLQPIEEDLAITYGFRNFGAHTVEDQPVVYQNFDEISRRILNALFFSVEKLYI